jgi:hypothetical protein
MPRKKRPDQATYPVLVLIAGMVWMVIGFGTLALSALSLALLLTSTRAPANQMVLVILNAVTLGVGGLFLLLGLQSVRGSGQSCMVPGIIAFVSGVVLAIGAAYVIGGSSDFDGRTSSSWLSAVVQLLFGLGLAGTGVAVCYADKSYRRWRQYQDAVENPGRYEKARSEEEEEDAPPAKPRKSKRAAVEEEEAPAKQRRSRAVEEEKPPVRKQRRPVAEE